MPVWLTVYSENFRLKERQNIPKENQIHKHKEILQITQHIKRRTDPTKKQGWSQDTFVGYQILLHMSQTFFCSCEYTPSKKSDSVGRIWEKYIRFNIYPAKSNITLIHHYPAQYTSIHNSLFHFPCQ